MYEFFTTLFEPYTFLILAIFVTTLVIRKRFPAPRRGWRILAMLVVLLVVVSSVTVAKLMIGMLEWPYPPLDPATVPRGTPIVVLSGYSTPVGKVMREPVLGLDSQMRCQYAADLYHRIGPMPIYVTGGKMRDDEPSAPLAEQMRDELIRLKVPVAKIVCESESKSTYENALLTTKLLEQAGEKKIVLITTARHLARAERCFAKLGIETIPAGCIYKTEGMIFDPSELLPTTEGIGAFRDVCHEWLGLLYYKLTGRI